MVKGAYSFFFLVFWCFSVVTHQQSGHYLSTQRGIEWLLAGVQLITWVVILSGNVDRLIYVGLVVMILH